MYSIDFMVISLWNLNHWKQKIFATGLQEKDDKKVVKTASNSIDGSIL